MKPIRYEMKTVSCKRGLFTAKLQAWHECNFTGLYTSTQIDQETVTKDLLLIHELSSLRELPVFISILKYNSYDDLSGILTKICMKKCLLNVRLTCVSSMILGY